MRYERLSRMGETRVISAAVGWLDWYSVVILNRSPSLVVSGRKDDDGSVDVTSSRLSSGWNGVTLASMVVADDYRTDRLGRN